MTLQVIVSCNGLRPPGNDKGERCRGWFPTGEDPEDYGMDEASHVADVAKDKAAAIGWSFPGDGALCPSCTKWRVEHPDEEEKVLGYKPTYPLPRVGGWVPVEVYTRAHGQAVLEQQRALVDQFAAELGVPPCVLAHAWTDWSLMPPERTAEQVYTGQPGNPYWERRCERAGCPGREVQVA